MTDKNLPGYLKDAKFIQADPSRLIKFVNAIRANYPGSPKKHTETLWAEARKFAAEFGLEFEQDPSAGGGTVNSDLNAIKYGNGHGKIPTYLAWLWCHQGAEDTEPGAAARAFYLDIGLKPRPYKRDPKLPSTDSGEANGDLRGFEMIVPSGPLLAKGVAVIGSDGVPLEGATKLHHPTGILGADFSPCGKFVVTAGKKGRHGSGVFVWRIKESPLPIPVAKIAYHEKDVAFVMFSPDGSRVAAAFEETAGIFHSRSSLPVIHRFKHDEQIVTIAYSLDGKRVVTASWDGTARVWSAESGKLLHTLIIAKDSKDPRKKPRKRAVNSAFFSPDNRQVVIASTNGTVTFWNVASGDKIGEIPRAHGTIDGVSSAQFSPDGSSVITTGGGDLKVSIWNAKSKQRIPILTDLMPHDDTLWSAEFSSDSKKIVTASDDGWSFVIDITTQTIVARLYHNGRLSTAHFSPDDRYVVTACADGNAYVWRVA